MPTHAPTLLIVDDTPANLDLLLDVLSQANYQILVAENGKTALARTRSVQPDLILLDVVMPDLDGFEVCRRLKADEATRHIPILFMTALSETVDKVRGFAMGGVDYITKPIHVAEVSARIQTQLTIRRLQQELEEHNQLLEIRIQQRTAELEAEVTLRKQNEAQKNHLLDVIRSQFDQLRQLTSWVIERQQQHDTGVASNLHTHIEQGLRLLGSHLDLIETVGDNQVEPTHQEIFATQLKQARTTVEQLQQGLHLTIAALSKPIPEAQAALSNPLLLLSTREREVLKLVADGNTNNEIARLLYLTEATVRTYRSRIMQKLQLEDISSLIKFAIKNNLTSLHSI